MESVLFGFMNDLFICLFVCLFTFVLLLFNSELVIKLIFFFYNGGILRLFRHTLFLTQGFVVVIEDICI